MQILAGFAYLISNYKITKFSFYFPEFLRYYFMYYLCVCVCVCVIVASVLAMNHINQFLLHKRYSFSLQIGLMTI